MYKEFFRSKTKIKTVINGQKSELAFCVKKGTGAQAFWYFVKFPCGGWREFDVRWVLENVNQREWMNAHIAEWDKGGALNVLEKVAEKIKDLDVFATILRHDELQNVPV